MVDGMAVVVARLQGIHHELGEQNLDEQVWAQAVQKVDGMAGVMIHHGLTEQKVGKQGEARRWIV